MIGTAIMVGKIAKTDESEAETKAAAALGKRDSKARAASFSPQQRSEIAVLRQKLDGRRATVRLPPRPRPVHSCATRCRSSDPSAVGSVLRQDERRSNDLDRMKASSHR